MKDLGALIGKLKNSSPRNKNIEQFKPESDYLMVYAVCNWYEHEIGKVDRCSWREKKEWNYNNFC